ncbi:MAG: type II secretion system major pseudopilin GspG [Patescibacteria group bacterium]
MKNKGFTLIELMLVVTIIGVLAAMVMPRFSGRSEQAKIAAAKTDINASISTSLDLFEMDNGRYPISSEGLDALSSNPKSSDLVNWSGPYLKRRPIDPWGRQYKYLSPGSHNQDYDLFSFGPDGVEDNEDDIKNWE